MEEVYLLHKEFHICCEQLIMMNGSMKLKKECLCSNTKFIPSKVLFKRNQKNYSLKLKSKLSLDSNSSRRSHSSMSLPGTDIEEKAK